MSRLLFALLLALPATDALAARVPAQVEDALAFAPLDRAKALALLEEATGSVREKDLPLVLVHLGEQQRLAGDLAAAQSTWTGVLRDHGRSKQVDQARLGLAVLEGAGGPLTSQVRSVFDEVGDREAIDSLASERHRLLLLEAARADDAEAVREHARLARTLATDPAQLARVESTLQKLAVKQVEPGAWQGVDEPEAPPLARAWAHLDAGERAQALQLADGLSFPQDSPEARSLDALRQLAQANATVKPSKLGVVLPLSGPYAPAGKQVREALELGYGDAASKRRLIVVDSGATAETAVAAAESLILEEGVVGIIGPLLTDESDPVAATAQAYHVPLVSLAQVPGLTSDRDWVYSGMVNPAQQIEALLDYVMSEEVGMDAFAIFAPDNNYGHVSAEHFRATVEARGGQISVEEFYDIGATDIIPFAKALGRKDYEARSREFYDLRKLAEKNGGNPNRVVLPPVLDFDGLFLPDSATRLPIACAALAYEEFPIGEFQTKRDGPTVPLLGLSGYNDSRLVSQGGPYVRRSIFVDALFEKSPDIQPYIEQYREATGRTPSTLEAAAWSTGRLLAKTVDAEVVDRRTFRDALDAASIEDSPLGIRGFEDSDHEVDADFHLLTISRSGIYPLGAVPDADLPQR